MRSARGRTVSPSAWQPEVLRAVEGYQAAVEAVRRATQTRALAVHQARQAGASLGEIAAVLGCSRKHALELGRMGARVGP